ncbi:MAG: FtsK/SpoIIIE domain-containing protein [Pirellulaceae bacterium]
MSLTAKPLTTDRECELIRKVTELVAWRAREERETAERDGARSEQAKTDFEANRSRATAAFERDHGALVAEYREAREVILFKYESDGYALSQQEETLVDQVTAKHNEALEDAKTLWQHRHQEIQVAFKDQEELPQKEFSAYKRQCDGSLAEVEGLEAQAQAIVRRRCEWPASTAAATAPPLGMSRAACSERAVAAITRIREILHKAEQAPAARFIEDGWPFLIFLFTLVATGVGVFVLWGRWDIPWPALLSGGVIIPIVVAIASRQIARPFARNQTQRLIPDMQQAIVQARVEIATTVNAAKVEAEQKYRQLVEKRDRDLAVAKSQWKETRHALRATHDDKLARIAEDFTRKRQTIEEINERQLVAVEAKYPHRIRKFEQDFERQMQNISESYRFQRADLQEKAEKEWTYLAAAWSAGLAEFQAGVDQLNEFCDAHFPPWRDNGALERVPPAGNVPAIRFGRFGFYLQAIPGGLPTSPDLAIPQESLELPALLSYPECPSLLLEAEGEGRDAATLVIQNMMLRLLTSLPPGKVRFTIIDPVGLGQNFSAFMHLADFDERLVTNRIWTESNHINQRLTDLTEHMENVIQKYLRNEFASIQQYNEHAGEVAEPFQILVVANFPANFSDEAARRLVSIAASGARCGVYTLISTDDKLTLPRNFDVADLESQAATLVWNVEQKRFAWKHDELKSLPLALESPPGDEQFTEIIKSVGKLAKDAARVEVPFESVTPNEAELWNGDSRSEIEVPLGRAGATKLQYMRLGKGTSQHVLISGKTGSGKSTLLNALITNLALHYSPSELQFYLIDFKKGVEFKAYASFRLPHARVIAIESEREFGMSVLERLDQELKHRGDLFRKHGVQDLKGYRRAEPDAEMPRVLLIIDEFQEFFTTDDRISHDSSLLLDRLVRQGRAFGIHLLLGSQTLAGAYSLARSTIGQMAVRIALQCSESDAHLILSEDNTAARLLSRPGEAIYNDANGLFEGNHPFQVVWLSDQLREEYLRKVAAMATERHLNLPPATVFEGNAAADIADNHLLREVLRQPPKERLAPRAWLGAAVAIKDPTQVLFRRQGGTNLLIVGQQEELALGILTSCLLGLAPQVKPAAEVVEAAATHSTNGAARFSSFYVLDGTRPDSPDAGFWRRMKSELPIDAQIVATRDAAETVAKIAAEVDRRLSSGDQNAEPIFLFIYNLASFRELKKSDDFGLSGFGEESRASGDKQLAAILREGPAHGVHTLIWCDSYNNVSRWIDRPGMRDLELRVLFQMSATDSSNLMDSPAASRLGGHVSIFYSEEQGSAEKFRPYGLPSAEWLASVKELLSSKVTAEERVSP